MWLLVGSEVGKCKRATRMEQAKMHGKAVIPLPPARALLSPGQPEEPRLSPQARFRAHGGAERRDGLAAFYGCFLPTGSGLCHWTQH